MGTGQTVILSRFGTIKKLKELFGVSRPFVTSALNGDISSDIAIRIRALALEMGGAEVPAQQEKKEKH